MPEKIKIMYVDDEHNNLVGFKASFRMDYQIFIASDTKEATEVLAKNPDIRIIFCDQRMPGKTGVEFFDEIRLQYPYIIRILLTAYADIEVVIDAINKGKIYRYVKKPWIDADIISAIEEGNKFYIANSMLALRNEELHKAYTELDKFAYSVTHDVRGPITGILTAINVAQGLDNVEEMKEMLTMMEKAVNRLDEFVLDMHDYYNVQRGELKIQNIDFRDVINDQKDIYNVYANSSHVKFNAKVQQDGTFRSDETSLKLILNNLLSNAFKYQKKDFDDKKVDLDIDVHNGVATIQIRDSGIGIADSDIREIFNLFFRANSNEAGFGIGLYNLKCALLKLNGNIEVDSQLGMGTTFKVVIPSK
jgi:signal transduction histidine kinase